MGGAFAQKAQAHDSRIVAYVFKSKGKGTRRHGDAAKKMMSSKKDREELSQLLSIFRRVAVSPRPFLSSFCSLISYNHSHDDGDHSSSSFLQA